MAARSTSSTTSSAKSGSGKSGKDKNSGRDASNSQSSEASRSSGAQGSTKTSGMSSKGSKNGKGSTSNSSKPSTKELMARQDRPTTFSRSDLDRLQALIEDAGGQIQDWACYGDPVDSIGASVRVPLDAVGDLVAGLIQEHAIARPELQIYPVGFPRPTEVEVNIAFGRLK